jgi:hypothetical protein
LRLASLFQRAPFVLLNALWLDSAAKEGKILTKRIFLSTPLATFLFMC